MNPVLPTLMMILVAMFGMIPAATAKGIGSDVQRPLATVVVGGLISTLMLALLALSLYYLDDRGRKGRSLQKAPCQMSGRNHPRA